MGKGKSSKNRHSSNGSDDFKNKLKQIWYKFKRNYMKFVPIVGLIVLLFLAQGSNASNDSQDNLPFKEKMAQLVQNIGDSIIIGDTIYWLTTVILLIVIWTGYKYWLLRIKAIRYNSKLLEKVVVIAMIVIILGKHFKLDSFLGKIGDWIIFLLLLYLVIAGSWLLAKIIDRIDLSSDLYCWGLRLVGLIAGFIGILIFASSSISLVFADVSVVSGNIFWILGICLTLLGVFMEFRSFRRYTMIKVW